MSSFSFLDSGLGLTLVVFLPLITAIFIFLIPKKQEMLIKLITLGSAIMTFLISLVVALQFDFNDAAELQLGTKVSWISSINSNYEIGIDGISLPLLLLSTFISVLAIIYSFEHLPEPKNTKNNIKSSATKVPFIPVSRIKIKDIIPFAFFGSGKCSKE